MQQDLQGEMCCTRTIDKFGKHSSKLLGRKYPLGLDITVI